MIQMFKNCVIPQIFLENTHRYFLKILGVDFFIMVCYYILWFFGINDTNCPGFRTAPIGIMKKNAREDTHDTKKQQYGTLRGYGRVTKSRHKR